MKKNITAILTGGFDIWRKNLVLPSLLNAIILTGLLFFFFISRPMEGELLFFFLLSAVIILLVNSFFTAGLIGMAKEAIETGKTEFKTMIDYGKRKFVSLFFANLIISTAVFIFTIILPLIFMVFQATQAPIHPNPTSYDRFSSTGMGVFAYIYLAVFFVILFIVLSWMFSIIFAVLNHAIVISDVGAMEGIKSAYEFFMRDKLDVFLIGSAISVIYLLTWFTFFLILYLGAYLNTYGIPLILLCAFISFVFASITAVWWSLLYIDRQINSTL